MSFVIGPKSRANSMGLHPHLIEIAERTILTFNFAILPKSVRTQAMQDEMYAQGRTTPGDKITWTRNSRHTKKVSLKYPQFGAVSHAMDLAPWPIDWNNEKEFLRMIKHVLAASIELGYPCRSGYDWDGDGIYREKGESDGPHIELALKAYPT